MASFREAARVGADGIELDVQLTKDGVPVILHDEQLDRTTNGKGYLQDHTYDQLLALDAGNGERIPRLHDVLDWMRGNSIVLNIELKNGLIRYPQLEEIVVRMVEEFQLEERVIISSFNHYSLVDVRRLNPSLETAILYMEGLYEPWNYARTVGASALHCFWPAAQPELLQGAAEHGMPLRPFTVNDESFAKRLIAAGCSAIFTDFPEQALSWRREVQG